MLNTISGTQHAAQAIPPMKVDEGSQDHLKVKSRSTLNIVPVTAEASQTKLSRKSPGRTSNSSQGQVKVDAKHST